MIEDKTREVFCRDGKEFIDYCGSVNKEGCPQSCRYAVRINLELLRYEMLGEMKNGMKMITKDWENIKKDYLDYKRLGLTTQESFTASLIDAGYLTLEDLK